MAWLAWDQMTLKKGWGGLGFKDLRLFNQALLARQAWSLLIYPDSLCARLLKARYYPHGHLLDTTFCSNPSSTWQAIMRGLNLLKKGAIWRVGDGKQIRIWRDPWIPREFSHRVSTRRGRCRLHWVAELLNTEGNNWDYNLLRGLFNAADVDAISRIRLATRRTEDFFAWQPEKTGIFSVRREVSTASSSRPAGDRKLWSNIWTCDVPPKVRIFAWKLRRDILPTKGNKCKRRLDASPVCDLCQ